MTSQVLFKIDPKIKAKAMKRAEKEGMAFSTVLKSMTRAYADGRFEVTVIDKPLIPNAKNRKLLNQIEKDFRLGKNLSPRFTNVEDAIAWLDK